MIHSGSNVVRTSAELNQKIANFYSSKRPLITGSNLTVRQWLTGQKFEVQHAFGVRAMNNIAAGMWK